MTDITHAVRGGAMFIRRFEVVVVDGPDHGARAVSDDDELTVGSATGASLRLSDPAVSRLHCVIRVGERGLELRDLGSTNGTFLGEHEIVRAFVRTGARIRLGATTIAVTIMDDELERPLASADRFGELLGASAAMRRLYPLLEDYARRDATVLIQGETGTGKEVVAETIHEASPRRGRPFVIVDCSALARQLAESELFGHVRGAFTGAELEREGAFAEADGGTIFLDEIGELPLELQPLLLRALDAKTIRKVGTNQHRSIDVRVIAASHRDLRVEVNAKRFRADLYYRLNVLRVAVPPLRERDGDIALLAGHFWRQFRPEPIEPRLLAELVTQSWPGNVRELRNTIERCALVGWTPPDDRSQSYGQAKEAATQQWERHWVERLLALHDNNVSRAARAAQMGRSHLRQLAQRYGLRPIADED
jgi:transcriptional regulator with GAF, ATPase, and Fis domain